MGRFYRDENGDGHREDHAHDDHGDDENIDGEARAVKRVDHGVLANPALLDRQSVASLLGCSTKHVARLSGAGRMPPPVRLGWLVRWRLADLERWIDAGCPRCA